LQNNRFKNAKSISLIIEAARINKVKKIIFASSNHAIGFHKEKQILMKNACRDQIQIMDEEHPISKTQFHKEKNKGTYEDQLKVKDDHNFF